VHFCVIASLSEAKAKQSLIVFPRVIASEAKQSLIVFPRVIASEAKQSLIVFPRVIASEAKQSLHCLSPRHCERSEAISSLRAGGEEITTAAFQQPCNDFLLSVQAIRKILSQFFRTGSHDACLPPQYNNYLCSLTFCGFYSLFNLEKGQ
jgi:hypothetical protein